MLLMPRRNMASVKNCPNHCIYGFRLIPAQSGKRRLCIHIAESVFFPTRIRSD